MVNYKLTKKGKVVIATLCTFIILCVYLGISFTKNNAPKHYDYGKPSHNTQQQVYKPQPPAITKEQEEPWKKLKTAVYFEADITSFDDKYYEALNTFITAALKYETARIQVEGNCATLFPSSQKQKAMNYKLSLNRAQVIANYLQSKGINADRLIIVANGSDKPLKDNSSPEGRKFNRRVEIFFVNK